MLPITIPATTLYDYRTNELYDTKEQTIKLEHSLVSISKWEQKYNVDFLARKLTKPELVDYIEFMTITQNVDPMVYHALTKQNFIDVIEYMERPMTAAKFSNQSITNTGEFITAETIYYLMFSFNIPKECEKWHINRLMALIRFFQVKNNPGKKMSAAETEAYYDQLNEQRKKAWGTKG